MHRVLRIMKNGSSVSTTSQIALRKKMEMKISKVDSLGKSSRFKEKQEVIPISLNLKGCGKSASISVFSNSLAIANISSAVETTDETVYARVFTSKFTFFSLIVTVLPYNKQNTLLYMAF